MGIRKPINITCNICGNIRTVTARSIFEKNEIGEYRKCPKCSVKEYGLKRRKTNKEFVEEMKSINPNIKFNSDYIKSDIKIDCECLICGNKWNAKPHSLLGNHGCPNCSYIKQNWRTPEQFDKEMKNNHPNIIYDGKIYKVTDRKNFKCTKCNYEWSTIINEFFNKKDYGCPNCNGGFIRISENEMINRVNQNNSYVEYVSGYTSVCKKAKFKCKKCNYIWEATPANIYSGKGCPKCNLSHGAKLIESILNKKNINYKMEYRFDNCKNERPLPFDFYLPDYNMCIEYDGEQHFKPIKFGKIKIEQMNEKFKKQKINDEIKNKYCHDNGIKLVRIPYTEYGNIENILNEHIS